MRNRATLFAIYETTVPVAIITSNHVAMIIIIFIPLSYAVKPNVIATTLTEFNITANTIYIYLRMYILNPALYIIVDRDQTYLNHVNMVGEGM